MYILDSVLTVVRQEAVDARALDYYFQPIILLLPVIAVYNLQDAP